MTENLTIRSDKNINDRALLRKYEDDLNAGGTGVIIMGAWGIVRILIELFLNTKEFLNLDNDDPEYMIVGMVSAIVIIAVISVVVINIHLYIGLNARRAARGNDHKKGYFAAAIILAVISVLGLTTYINDIKDLYRLDTTLASMLVDITSIYLYILVIVSSVRIKGIKKES